MEPIAELRRKVQTPVKKYNDVAGLLIGDHVSIHLTRLFVTLGISPTIATLSMLGFGVVGSLMILLGGWIAPLGFACVFVYYILDCVDGEVARYHHGEKLIWGFYDFLFHLAVKSTFFVCLGVYTVRMTGKPWTFAFALAALLACLFQKFLTDLSLILTCRQILLRTPAERDHFVKQIVGDAAPEQIQVDGDLPGEHLPYSHRGVLPVLRAVLTNFDLAVVFFMIAAIVDQFVAPFQIYSLHADFRIALVMFYGIVFPFDFIDHLQTQMRTRRFFTDSRRLLRKAHHFTINR